MPPISDDAYLVMCKKAGLPDDVTAARLNRSEEWVKTRWAELQDSAKKLNTNGYLDLIQQFTIFAHQYQLLGESLKVMALALDASAAMEDLTKLGCSREMAGVILTNYIVLRPFVAANQEPPTDPLEGN